MCGITGIVDHSGASNDALLQKMRDTLAHRGPDSRDQISWKNNGYVGLAHRRLAIIDASVSGNQPMHFKDLSVVFNGEIYNYRGLKHELQTLGHVFETNSDTEVLLHAFYEWNLNAVHRFKGMFSIALLNHQTQKLYLFRDRFGVKPLYYYTQENSFLFASELKALQHHPNFKKKLNADAIAHFFLYGNVPAPKAIFENTFKLLPGSFLQLNLQDAAISLYTYWNPSEIARSTTTCFDGSLEEAKQTIKPLLEDSVYQRTIADVPIGLFLSGGYDSATAASILVQQVEKLKTFTVSVPDAGLNEGPKAREIADFLGTQHTEIICSVEDAISVIHELPFIYDEPFADSSAIPTYLVAKAAVKSVKVALSADGGDELFGGYNRYRYYYKLPRIINLLPRFVGGAVSQSLNFLKWEGLKAQRAAKFSQLIGDFSTETYLKAMTQSMSDDKLMQLLCMNQPVTPISFHKAHSPISTLMLNDTMNYLPNDILHKVDRATMAVGLEGREPFLDHELYEVLMPLPDHLKCTKRESKVLLKAIAHDYIPESILTGPKKGFAIPINQWMRDFLKEELRHYASEDYLLNQQIFNPQEVQREIQKFLDGNDVGALFAWYFYTFQTWYDRWM
jgi:asparagine synthase (glutamine-hydrolysing)